jgi:hypothetical protein
MNGTKRNGPRAKGTALRNTVLGNGKGMISWLVVEKRPGHYSIANGQACKKEIQDDTSVDNNDSQNQWRTHPNNHNPMEKRRRKRE